MIKKLRRKLIAACMLSLAIVLTAILGGVNLMSYHKVAADADAILAVLADNGGSFPKPQGAPENSGQDALFPFGLPGGPKGLPNPAMSPETPYESRFFSVVLDADGQVLRADTGQIAAVDQEEAAAAARDVAAGAEAGFWGEYRYLRRDTEEGRLVVFLDCSRGLSNFRTTLAASLLLAAAGLSAVLVLLLILSSRIVRPVAESYAKQKQFITDAGHELKTPLTIIGADAELAEMECGENQWLADIRRQAGRLAGLTHDLIYLSRMEEEQPRLSSIQFPLSDLVEEVSRSFLAPAKSQDKALSLRIQPMLAFTGDEKAIRQLVSILLDNALKYSPAGGSLEVSLEKQGRGLVLAVSNTTAQPVDRGQLAHLFDRFYRGDQSRSQTGGYGLGLSIARSVVAAHRGKIRAESPDGHTLTIQVTLPA